MMVFNNDGQKIKVPFFPVRGRSNWSYSELLLLNLLLLFIVHAINKSEYQVNKALFRLPQFHVNYNVKMSLKLFNYLITPILYHGCETWGLSLLNGFENNNYMALYNKPSMENVLSNLVNKYSESTEKLMTQFW